jgi:hypothetical protein
MMNIDSEGLMLTTGAVLLGLAAFMGFAQAGTSRGSAEEARWRVVHNGGTAGGVQLLALSAVWTRLCGQSPFAGWVAVCLALSTWLFFIGPLLKALSRVRSGNAVLWAGAVASLPAYLGLIAFAVTCSPAPLK